MFRVLFIGLGSIGQRHLRNINEIFQGQVEISAYRQRGLNLVLNEAAQIEEGVSLEEKYNITRFDSLEEALNAKPNAVFITNPSSQHLETAIRVANAGLDFFLEKPLSNSLDRVHELIELVERKGIVAFVGFQYRFHPCIQKTKRALEQGLIGDVVCVNAEIGEYMPGWHKYEDYRGTYAASRELGGGVILSQVHEFDYIYHFFGFPDRLFALGGRLGHFDIDVEDTASTLLDYSFEGRTFPVHVHQDYFQAPPVRSCKIIGTEGKIEFDLLAPSFSAYNAEGQMVAHENFDNFKKNDMYIQEMNSFLQSVKNHSTSAITLEEGAGSLKLALATHASLGSGRAVELRKDGTCKL